MIHIDHVGLATADLQTLADLYTSVLGFRAGERETLPEQGVDVLWLHAGGGANVELLAPLEADSPVGRFLEKHGAGMHHLALRVPDVAQALQRCRQAGLELIDQAPRRGSGGTLVAFVHPKSAHGVLIELVQTAHGE
jgi:methylmalonyl-CoA/ethylmalonyl-CoA epimerase